MFITSQTMRAVAWSALALSAAQAQYVIDNLSFGQKDGTPISPNLRAIPHFHIFGEGFTPEILSDRIFLTPPYPGSKRGALWADDPLHHKGDWTAELHFRVSGMERGSGNLQLWYTKESQNHQLPQSIYTAHKFDGMVLVIDQYDGRGGTVRGFLNDGTIDIKSHPDADTLAFGQCGYSYRNLGRLSVLKLSQANGVLKVSVDGNGCFETDKVKLPEDYYFGLSASSAENPDSFEIHKFIVSTTNSQIREDVKHDSFRQPPSQGHQQFIPTDTQGQKVPPRSKDETQQMLQDVLAGSIKSQADQFADLHNRIQIINQRVNTIYDMLERLETDSHNRHNDVMNRVAPIDDRTSAMVRNVEKVERINMDIQRDLASKDFKDMLNRVHNAIQDSHSGLSSTVPEVVNQIVAEHRHSLTSFLLIAVAVQVTVVGAYMAYKRRSKGAPKKYL